MNVRKPNVESVNGKDIEMKTTILSRVMGGMALAAALMLSAASYAQDKTWADVVTQAMAGKHMLTMEMVNSYAEREEQFAGFRPWMTEHFEEIDADDDGMVTMDEMHVWMEKNNVTDTQLTKAWYEQGR